MRDLTIFAAGVLYGLAITYLAVLVGQRIIRGRRR